MGKPMDTVERFYAAFAAGELDLADELFDPACITYMPGGAVLTQPEHKGMAQVFKNASPDSRMVVDKVVETGDQIAIVGYFRGTHTGDMVSPNGTIPASGNAIDLRFIDYFAVVGDRITEHVTVFDQMEFLGQLGALPPA